MGEKKKMLVNSIFPFLTTFSTSPEFNFNLWITFILSAANATSLDQSTILLFGKELILYQLDPMWMTLRKQLVKMLDLVSFLLQIF